MKRGGTLAFGGGAPAIVDEVLRTPGQPFDPAVRRFMEPRFGRSFSDVRVHADAQPGVSAGTVGALAYTVGSHVVFAHNCYSPEEKAVDGYSRMN